MAWFQVVGAVVEPFHGQRGVADGGRYGPRRNSSGQLGIGSIDNNPHVAEKVTAWSGKATHLALGDNFTCALRDDGKAFCWGGNSSGQLGDGSAFTHVPTPVKGLP